MGNRRAEVQLRSIGEEMRKRCRWGEVVGGGEGRLQMLIRDTHNVRHQQRTRHDEMSKPSAPRRGDEVAGEVVDNEGDAKGQAGSRQ